MPIEAPTRITPEPSEIRLRATVDDLRIVNLTPSLLEEWALLEQSLPTFHLTCSATWLRTWLANYGDLVPHRVAVATQDGRTVGMSLITNGVRQHDGPLPVKTVHVGTAGEPEDDSICVELNRLLVAPAHRAEFSRQLVAHITTYEPWEAFHLDGFTADDVEGFLARTSQRPLVREVPSHYCDLNRMRETLAEPSRVFGSSTRSNLRRHLRDLGDVQLDWAESVDQALDFYKDMIVHHQARWTAVGKRGVFASSRFQRFHHDLIEAFVPEQRVVLVRARQGNRVLGISYLFIEQNRLFYYQGGLPEHDSKLSLGNLTHYLTMVEGARRGYDAYDFMAGDTHYKRLLSTDCHSLFWLRWRRPTVKFALLDGLRKLKVLVKQGLRNK